MTKKIVCIMSILLYGSTVYSAADGEKPVDPIVFKEEGYESEEELSLSRSSKLSPRPSPQASSNSSTQLGSPTGNQQKSAVSLSTPDELRALLLQSTPADPDDIVVGVVDTFDTSDKLYALLLVCIPDMDPAHSSDLATAALTRLANTRQQGSDITISREEALQALLWARNNQSKKELNDFCVEMLKAENKDKSHRASITALEAENGRLTSTAKWYGKITLASLSLAALATTSAIVSLVAQMMSCAAR